MEYRITPRVTKAGQERFAVSMEVWDNGARRNVSGGTHESNEMAVRAGERLLLKYEDDAEKLKVIQGTRLLEDWAEEWLDGLTVKQSSINAYRDRMRQYVLPTLGKRQLKALSPQVINEWLQSSALSHLDKSTLYHALDVLRNCLHEAVAKNMLPVNPAREVKIKRTKAQQKADKTEKKVKTWNYKEVDKLLAASVGTKIEPVVVLGLLAGLRPGECMAVRWCDIDWAAGTVKVSRTAARTAEGKMHIAESTKSGETRHPRLTSDATFRLMRIKEIREKEGPVKPEDRIYEFNLGTTGSATTWTRIKYLCKAAEIPFLPPHSLRHTHASLLLENGATLAAVARQLGHSNPNITANVYWHLINQENDTITGVMDQALRRSAASEPDLSNASETD